MFEKNHTKPAQEITLTPEARNWYVNIGKPAATFTAQLGYRRRGGGFHVISQSGEATTPAEGMSGLQRINKSLSDGVKLGDTWSTATVAGAVILSEGAKLGDTWGIKQTINKLFSEGIKGGDTWQALSSGYNIVYTSIVFYAAVKLKSVRFDPVT